MQTGSRVCLCSITKERGAVFISVVKTSQRIPLKWKDEESTVGFGGSIYILSLADWSFPM